MKLASFGCSFLFGFDGGQYENKDYSVPYLSAAEIQVLDDDIYGKNDTANFNHMNGALYDMVAPSKLFANPTGEWNHYLIEINYNDNVGNVDLNGNFIIPNQTFLADVDLGFGLTTLPISLNGSGSFVSNFGGSMDVTFNDTILTGAQIDCTIGLRKLD